MYLFEAQVCSLKLDAFQLDLILLGFDDGSLQLLFYSIFFSYSGFSSTTQIESWVDSLLLDPLESMSSTLAPWLLAAEQLSSITPSSSGTASAEVPSSSNVSPRKNLKQVQGQISVLLYCKYIRPLLLHYHKFTSDIKHKYYGFGAPRGQRPQL